MIEMCMMIDLDLGLMITATIPIAICKKLLMVVVKVDIGPISATLPPTAQVTVIYCCVYLLILVVLMIVLMAM